MSLPFEQLEAEVMRLPQEARARLAERLIASLDELPEDDQRVVDREWEEEIRRRVTELEAGDAELIPAEKVIADLRARSRR